MELEQNNSNNQSEMYNHKIYKNIDRKKKV